MQEDHIIKLTRDLAKFVALLTGLARKGDLDGVVELIERALQHDFGLLDTDHLGEAIEGRLNTGRISLEDLRTIGELFWQKGELLPEQRTAQRAKARIVWGIYLDRSSEYDLSVALRLREG